MKIKMTNVVIATDTYNSETFIKAIGFTYWAQTLENKDPDTVITVMLC
jgi:hypothetical protein